MNPRDYCHDCGRTETKKQYQLVIMMEDGRTYCCTRLHDWNGIQEAIKEMRELYSEHGVGAHIGYREV